MAADLEEASLQRQQTEELLAAEKEKTEALELQLADAGATIDALNGQVENLQTSLRFLSRHLSATLLNQETLQQNRDVLQARLDGLEENTAAQNADRADIQTKIRSLEAAITSLQSSLGGAGVHDSRSASLQTQIDAMRIQIQKLQESDAALGITSTETQAEIAKLIDQIEALNALLTAMELEQEAPAAPVRAPIPVVEENNN